MDDSSITPNTSNQQLVINNDNDSATALLQEKRERRETLRDVSLSEYMTIGVLCFVNLINYMDRFTLAGKCFLLYITHLIRVNTYNVTVVNLEVSCMNRQYEILA